MEAFLAVYRCRNLTKAASTLYITQSSLSTRLKTLERELGGTLFLRRKGRSEVLPTQGGVAFYPLALQQEQLLAQMRQIFRTQPQALSIALFNSLGAYLIPDVYECFKERYPDVYLEIQDMETEAACRSIRRGLTDLAFTTKRLPDDTFLQIPVFREPMVLISAGGTLYPTPVLLGSLPVQEELYIEWCNDFIQWHQEVFGPRAKPKIKISIMDQLRRLLQEGHSWAVVPVSVADGLGRELELHRYHTDRPLPARDVSCFMSADGKDRTQIWRFLSCVKEILERWSEIECTLQLSASSP